MSARALLALHAAAAPFLRRRDNRSYEDRKRLREAIVQVMKERGAMPPPDLIQTSEEALSALQALLTRCEQLGVNWGDVVATVNREWTR